jgi:hypothetical protein
MVRSNCSTAAILAWIICTDTGFELPSVNGSSWDRELLLDRGGQDTPGLAGPLDDVAALCDIRCSANGLDVMLHWNAERQIIPTG